MFKSKTLTSLTLLNLIGNRLDDPYVGDVFINGEKIERGKAFNFAKIAYSTQSKRSAGYYRVRDELYDHRDPNNPNDVEKVNEIVKYFKCERLLDAKIKSLSGGQEQIVYIMSAFLRKESDLIMLDEPINNLDRQKATLLSDYIKDFIKANPKKAIVIVTHCRMFPKVTAYNLEQGILTPLEDDGSCGASCFGCPDENGYYRIVGDKQEEIVKKERFFDRVAAFFKTK